MNKSELLQNYIKDVSELRARAKKLEFSDEQIDTMFKEVIDELEETSPPKKYTKTIIRTLIFLVIIAFACYVLLYVHQPTSSVVLRNVQGLIYPGLKFIRFLSMPVIKYMSSLTELYDEACLVQNPYFYVTDMECWPCQNVRMVLNMTGVDNVGFDASDNPYVKKTNQRTIHLDDIKTLYETNSLIFDTNANRLKSSLYNITVASDLLAFNPDASSDVHITWRIIRMHPARIFRQLFPSPSVVNEWSGQSIERFLMIDGAKAPPYKFPDFECSNVVMIQGSGERMIVLKATRECERKCKTISVLLKPSFMLWYNWWYWRPLSFPVINSTETSVSYVTSYC